MAVVDHVQAYVDAVIAGEIITGIPVRLECERHNRYRNDPDNRWFFDVDEAARAIEFVETFCSISKSSERRLILAPWQKFIVGMLFGWKEKSTEVRRFKKALIMIARKNGKSLILSAISTYCLIADGERGAEIYCLSNSQKQARIIFDETAKMVKANKFLSKNVRTLRDTLFFDRTDSKFEPRASDSGKLDGLNTHLGIFDEIHEFKDYKLISVIENSMMARKQPLLVFITTAGYVLDGALIKEYEQGKKFLATEDPTGDRIFYYIAELDPDDDIEEPQHWVKANPNLGISFTIDQMVEDWGVQKQITDTKVDFITKRLNKFVDWKDKSFIDYEIMQRNEASRDPGLLTGKSCVVGIDASVSGDLTSVVFEFDIDGIIHIDQMTFLPRTKLTSKNNDKYDYRVALADGDAMIAGEDSVDAMVVYDYIVAKSREYNIIQINYDRAYAQELVAKLRLHFSCLEIRQGHYTLSEPMSDIRRELMNGNVNHANCALFKWFVTNTEVRYDVNGNIAPNKKESHFGNKIDGFSAWLNAHVTIYERRLLGLNDEPTIEILTF
ncbi:MAG: terminase large subunit [Bacilli bacterium]